jgi:hypothetical protein
MQTYGTKTGKAATNRLPQHTETKTNDISTDYASQTGQNLGTGNLSELNETLTFIKTQKKRARAC